MRIPRDSWGWFTAGCLGVFAIHIATATATTLFLPVEAYTFRAWEPLTAHPTALGLFTPNQTYRRRYTSGDLAHLGNYAAVRQWRPETFTTDACGNRNPAGALAARPADILVMGSSFSIGSGVSDELTISSRLREVTGRRVYNAAGEAMEDAPALAAMLHMRGAWVVAEFLERYDAPRPDQIVQADTPLERRCAAPLTGWQQWQSHLPLTYDSSPLPVLTSDAIRRLQNGTILPNPYADRVEMSFLENGDPMLFYPEEVESGYRPRDVEGAVGFWTALRDRLTVQHLQLLVLLAPNKYTVYYPLLRAPERPAPNGAVYLRALQRALVDAGIPAVDLTGPLQEAAASGLPRGDSVYWNDDTHWNAAGIDLAARLAAEAMGAR